MHTNSIVKPAPTAFKSTLKVPVPDLEGFVFSGDFLETLAKEGMIITCYDSLRLRFFGQKQQQFRQREIRVREARSFAADIAVIRELGDEMTGLLNPFFYLIRQQGRGEPGPLHTNGLSNTIYARDVDSNLCGIFAVWNKRWLFGAYPAEGNSMLGQETLILST